MFNLKFIFTRSRFPLILFPLFFLFCGTMPAQAGQQAEYLVYQSNQTTFFAEQEYTLIWNRGRHYWQDADALKVRMVYANKTIFERNYQPVFPLKLDFKYPKLRPGIIADPVIVITAFSQGQVLKDVYQKQLFFFSQNQEFAPGLHEKDIGILDQTEEGVLTALMNELEISFTKINDFSDFDGDWIISAGLDFTGSFSLFDELTQAFSRGVSLLILPPMEGEFSWPSLPEETRATFSHESIVQDFDQRLNLFTAGPEGTQADVYFQLGINGEDVVVKCAKADKGYSWLEFRGKESKMIFLGWNLQTNVKTNPTTRILLKNILTQERNKKRRLQ